MSVDTTALKGIEAPPLNSLSTQSFSSELRTLPFPSRTEEVRDHVAMFGRNLSYDLRAGFLSAADRVGETRGEVFWRIERQAGGDLAKLVGSMQHFQREYLENIVTRDAWKELGPELGYSVIKLATELMELPQMRRLCGVRQMGAAYIADFKDILTHNRLEHSLEVGFNAARMAKRTHLGNSEALTLAAAGFLHDIGHTPFSHVGEDIFSNHVTTRGDLDKLGCRSKFDHELYGQSLIRGAAVSGVLRRNGLTGEHVINVLTDGHKLYSIIDWEDRASYLTRDILLASRRNAEDSRTNSRIIRVIGAIDKFRSKVGWYNDQFVLKVENEQDKAIPKTLFAHRLGLLNDVSLSPEVLLVDALLRRELEKSFQSKAIAVNKFPEHSDESAMLKMAPRARRALMTGVDSVYTEIARFTMSELSPSGHNVVTSREGQKRLVQRVIDGVESEQLKDVLIGMSTASYHKAQSVHYLTRGIGAPAKLSHETIETRIFPWCQYISFFAVKDQEEGSKAALARRIESTFRSEGMLLSPGEAQILYKKPVYQRRVNQVSMRGA